MVVPDFELICEIMLVAEGFIEARLLARKFITLYQLCKELLSKQVGYLRRPTAKHHAVAHLQTNRLECSYRVWTDKPL